MLNPDFKDRFSAFAEGDVDYLIADKRALGRTRDHVDLERLEAED